MKIYNYRQGLATNSSSSHSMIFMDHVPHEEKPNWEQFGWDEFTLTSPEMKDEYLRIILKVALESRGVAEKTAQKIAATWTPKAPGKMESIDHNSIFGIPNAYGSNFIEMDFFDDLRDMVMNPKLVILGGNDNSDGHPLRTEEAFALDHFYWNSSVARKDPLGFWTCFNPTDGEKIRFSFDEPSNSKYVPTKASAPELVDIKITDFCPYGCKFCYQGSTKEGSHATFANIVDIANALEYLQVFEVALGGGEPTLHPEFADILETFRNKNIVPNFTTRNLSWLNDSDKVKRYMKHAGAFAFSAMNVREVEELGKAVLQAGVNTSRVNIHIVMGTIERAEFTRMLMAAKTFGIRCTLLGFKTDGRGKQFNPIDYSWWLRDAKALYDSKVYFNLSIDTALAQQYEKQILASGIPQYMFHTQEGKFSMYIDAVAMAMGPSSYGLSNALDPINLEKTTHVENGEIIRANFKRY